MSRGVHPRRSILFVSHTAEEAGLLGSRWYTSHSTVPMDSVVAEIDQDMVERGTATDFPRLVIRCSTTAARITTTTRGTEFPRSHFRAVSTSTITR
jgi:Zn-dependent M28 family amino/carboxypeptidase